MRMVAALDQLPDGRHARGAQQFAQLGQRLVAAVGDDGDQEGALARTPPWALSVHGRLDVRLTLSLHKADGSCGSSGYFYPCGGTISVEKVLRPRSQAADPLDRLEQPLVGR